MLLNTISLFARAAYCPASSTKTWSCGVACNELPGFIPYAAGGDGDLTPYWYVGYYPPLESIIISNQGLDPSSLLHLLQDTDIATIPLNPLLFPGVGISVQALGEFQLAQAGSASEKLSAVQKAMSEQQATQVTLTGHNMGMLGLNKHRAISPWRAIQQAVLSRSSMLCSSSCTYRRRSN
ncbi:hypothetical protein FRC08_008059 [Ceratobasidium sp. 394]|nr:hypothetical protein FRC08_008059 [Ceratobasidium sp. 394]